MPERSSLARYIATSAERCSCCTSAPWSGYSAMPDAGLQLEQHALEPERLGQRRLDPQRHLGRRLGVRDGRQQHGELVAAEPGDHVLGPQRAADPLGDVLEQPVAHLVPEGVVDLLEPVEVEQEQPDPPARRHLARARWSSASSRYLRLGSPVSASWLAWCSFSSDIADVR